MLQNMLTKLKFELAEPHYENVCSNMIRARSIRRELMEAQQNSTQELRASIQELGIRLS